MTVTGGGQRNDTKRDLMKRIRVDGIAFAYLEEGDGRLVIWLDRRRSSETAAFARRRDRRKILEVLRDAVPITKEHVNSLGVGLSRHSSLRSVCG